LDKLDTDRLLGEIIVLKEFNDSEEYDCTDSIENEIEEIFEDIVEDMLDELKETDEDEICTHCVLKEAVQRGYVEGYRKAQEMLRNALNENLKNMR
jgi:flagellar biosynthesis/type III secretory pathway protein FliH